MELHQLEAFEAVALHRSFTRAAESLFLTQPAVTRQIAALEGELKTRLFDRLGRTVQMTTAGEALHRYSELILRLIREAREAVGDTESGEAGKLTVGASSTLATYVLPHLLRRFRETLGGGERIEIAIHTGVSARILDMVRGGNADIGLVTGEGDAAEAAIQAAATPRDPLLDVRILADYETCVVVPTLHPLAERKRVTVAQIAPYSMILMESGTNLRTYVDRLLSTAGVPKQITMELDNVEAIKRMIEADLGISILPQVAVRAEVEEGRLAALTLSDSPRRAHRRIALVYRRDKYLSAPLKAFMALLEREVGESVRVPSVESFTPP
ncbi:MAG: LysR family transcriptional regulator [Cytophagales bacterium]|nr:LysR family transcriptional regulator [Armatimonadota bacterium]